jgi:hypothetical protein
MDYCSPSDVSEELREASGFYLRHVCFSSVSDVRCCGAVLRQAEVAPLACDSRLCSHFTEKLGSSCGGYLVRVSAETESVVAFLSLFR